MPKCTRPSCTVKIKPYSKAGSMADTVIPVDKHWNDETAGFSLISYDNIRFYFPLEKLWNEWYVLHARSKPRARLKEQCHVAEFAELLSVPYTWPGIPLDR